jgi:hypothetical protein
LNTLMRAAMFFAITLVCGLNVHAQDQRDPTLPPVEIGASTSALGAATTNPLGEEGVTVIVRDGKSFLVVGTRLVAPGQKVGAQRLERITETEIWMRDGKTLIKTPRFVGIQRSVAAPAVACAAPAPQPPKTKQQTKAPKGKPSQVAPKVAPCESAQP